MNSERSAAADAMAEAIRVYLEAVLTELNAKAVAVDDDFESISKKLALLQIQKYATRICYEVIMERIQTELKGVSETVN